MYINEHLLKMQDNLTFGNNAFCLVHHSTKQWEDEISKNTKIN